MNNNDFSNSPLNFFLNIIQSGGNPEQMMMKYLESQNTPMSNNLLQMAKRGDTQGIESIARNMCQQRGIDFDTAFKSFRNQYRI